MSLYLEIDLQHENKCSDISILDLTFIPNTPLNSSYIFFFDKKTSFFVMLKKSNKNFTIKNILIETFLNKIKINY
jgi:hypothetical protein